MKTTKITSEPNRTIYRFVQVLWYQANEKNASEISLNLLEDGKVRIFFDQENIDPPPASLFKPVVKQFLNYTEAKIWPWTKRIKDKLCCIEIDDNKTEWSMHSDDLSKSLIIGKRNVKIPPKGGTPK